MSHCISIVVKNDFHEFGDRQKEIEYAAKSLPRFHKIISGEKYKDFGLVRSQLYSI